MYKFTYEQIVALKPCSLDKIPEFGAKETIGIKEALEAGVSIDDICWVAGKLKLTKELVEFANKCANSVKDLKSAAETATTAASAAACAAYDAAYDAAMHTSRYAAETASDAANATIAEVYTAARAADATKRSATDAAAATYEQEIEKQKQFLIEIFS